MLPRGNGTRDAERERRTGPGWSGEDTRDRGTEREQSNQYAFTRGASRSPVSMGTDAHACVGPAMPLYQRDRLVDRISLAPTILCVRGLPISGTTGKIQQIVSYYIKLISWYQNDTNGTSSRNIFLFIAILFLN